MQKQTLVGIILIVAVVSGVVGYVIGASVSDPSSDVATIAKLEEVKKMFPVGPESNLISGQIKSISGNVISLDVPPSSPFDESPRLRQVSVGSATKMVKNENKPMSVFQKEQDAYNKKMANVKPGSTSAVDMPTPPSMFVEKEISISDLKNGDQISVEGADKISRVEKFEAVKITLTMSAPTNLPPAPAPAPVAP